jgi:hypothetical protein
MEWGTGMWGGWGGGGERGGGRQWSSYRICTELFTGLTLIGTNVSWLPMLRRPRSVLNPAHECSEFTS